MTCKFPGEHAGEMNVESRSIIDERMPKKFLALFFFDSRCGLYMYIVKPLVIL